ncbi:MAG: helix-turn-helix domain-containing protein [Ruminococcaceae bacterium]|nr:helix-turn-helix domain-containing protein [Oscillospiraceae bacterium]
MDSISTGKKIRALRHSAGLTLEQLATALKIKKNMLSYYELGKSSISADLLSKIADYFDVSLDSLTERPNVFNESNVDEPISCSVYSKITTEDFSDNKQNRLLHTITLPEHLIGNGNFFGLKITDDSLNMKNIPKGAVVIAREQNIASIGSIVIYIYKGSAAKYGIFSFTNENVIISPCSQNSVYKPELFKTDDENFKILGKVTWVLGPVG